MPKPYKLFIVSSLALLLAFVGIFSVRFAFDKGQSPVNAYANQAPSAKPAVAHMVAMHTVNMQHVPAGTATALHSQVRTLPFLTGVSQAVYAQRKAAAAHSTHAPVDTHAISDVNTPTTTAKFNGMADSASIFPYFGGCQPPHQALPPPSHWSFPVANP